VWNNTFSDSNREWSRQYVDAPFFSRFAPAIELEYDSAADGDEDANIRAAQAILFRSRTKAAPSKEDQQGRMELKVTPRRPGPLTPSRREVPSPTKGNPVEKIDARFGTTPVKLAMNGLTGTPRGALSLSGSKQRCEDLHHKID
jgi:hypothetical protein